MTTQVYQVDQSRFPSARSFVGMRLRDGRTANAIQTHEKYFRPGRENSSNSPRAIAVYARTHTGPFQRRVQFSLRIVEMPKSK